MGKEWWHQAFCHTRDKILDNIMAVAVTTTVSIVLPLAYGIWAYFEDLPRSTIIPLVATCVMVLFMATFYATRIVDWREERRKREFRLAFEFDPEQHVSDTRSGKKVRVIVRNTGKKRLIAVAVKIDSIKPIPGVARTPNASEAAGYFLCQADQDTATSYFELPLPHEFALNPDESKPISVAHLCGNRPSWLLVTEGSMLSNPLGTLSRTPRAKLDVGAYEITLLAISREASCRGEFRLTTGDELAFDWHSPSLSS